MMVIDTSAIVAILQKEPESDHLMAAIVAAERRFISAASVLESAIVLGSRFGSAGEADLDVFLKEAQVQLYPVTADQIQMARHAFREFGKGRHPAGLNFGDCFSYALSTTISQPLLFKGADFSNTDVACVIY
jgi:ribonuclease VapC